MTWLDTIVLTVVAGVGLAIFYKALHEPLSLLFGFIGRLLKSGFDKLTGADNIQEVKTIEYS